MGEQKLGFEMDVNRSDIGKADTLRYNVCTFVVDQQYDRACDELRTFLDHRSPFPQFHDRVERYVLHAIDLVNAIRAKRNFPGASYLTMAKQQELNERFSQHFQELQTVLKRIEKVQVDLRVSDIRSTVLVVQALSIAVLVIFIAGLTLEIKHGLAHTTYVVIDDGFSRALGWIIKKIIN